MSEIPNLCRKFYVILTLTVMTPSSSKCNLTPDPLIYLARSIERICTFMTITVEDLFRAPAQHLPRQLSPLPGLLRRAQSTSCKNASHVLTSPMIPAESEDEARSHTYRVFRDGILARAQRTSSETRSIVSQIIGVVEQMSFEEAGRLAVLGAITAKIDDPSFLITMRDQFSRP